MKKLTIYFLLNLLIFSVLSQPAQNYKQSAAPILVNGFFPVLSVVGVHEGRSETGIGALMVWANKLWMVSSVAHSSGGGAGLYEISDDMTMILRSESITGTYANRMVHDSSNQAIIGPHIIDIKGNVRTGNSGASLNSYYASSFSPR